MDSLTHIALGACVGEAFFGSKIGKKALWIGALAQSIPDFDFITGAWMNPAKALLAHRGFTHSFVFVLLAVPLLSKIFRRIFKSYPVSYGNWAIFLGIQLLLHLFIDSFNGYGVGLFEPFSHYRVSFNTVFVMDPLFSLWPVVALIILWVLPRSHASRTFWWRFGVFLSGFYLIYCTVNKLTIDSKVNELVNNQHISYTDFMTTPTPFNNLLWYVILKTDHGYEIGYRSLFDSNTPMQFQYFEKGDSLLQPFCSEASTRDLIRFSRGYYSVSRWNDTIVFNDLRFGQEGGWYNPNGRFIFHYYLTLPGDNRMVVQRGRFEFWNRKVITSLFERIEGN
ncbi:MAG: metal-dependent hydrolase [Bacteroidota bacterium]|nr:metal-dependent hydrolase [Bacteroidota bacterium]